MLFEILNLPSLHLFHYHHFTHTFRYFVHGSTYIADDSPPARVRADFRDQLPDTILIIPFIQLIPSGEPVNVSFMWLRFCVVTLRNLEENAVPCAEVAVPDIRTGV